MQPHVTVIKKQRRINHFFTFFFFYSGWKLSTDARKALYCSQMTKLGLKSHSYWIPLKISFNYF